MRGSRQRWVAKGAGALVTLFMLSVPGCSQGRTPDGTGAPLAVSAPPAGPFVRVLGTAQDGGLPHVACTCARCEAARSDRGRARAVASVAIIVPATGQRILVDATPDIREQLHRLPRRTGAPGHGVDRNPVEGILLSHAHLGHYTGLAFLGFEAAHTRAVPVYCTPSLAAFLETNGPWDQLVRLGNIELHRVDAGGSVELDGGIRVVFVRSPHRDEYADTVGFRIEGPERTLLYVPDTDRWDDWEPTFEDQLQGVDVAWLDGTFYSLDELPGRRVESIGHPLIASTMDRLESRVRGGTLGVAFTHLNHSNPALDPSSAAGEEIRRRGFRVLSDGEDHPL